MPSCTDFPGPLPNGLIQLASDTLTAEKAATMVGTGGQVCYVELVNNTLHATPLTLRFYDATPSGEKDRCSSTFIMTPGFGTKKYFTDSVFGDKITWRCEVATSMDVDVANVLCRMLALPPQ